MTESEAASLSAQRDGVVIVGAGQAGARAAAALRKLGFPGTVTLLGDEPHPPYERPSLSKKMLTDLSAEAIVWARPEHRYAEERIVVRTASRVAAIDRAERSVTLESGERIPYGALVLATGSRPRRLTIPGADLPVCHYVRTLDDSRALRHRLSADCRVVVIGAGFIGLEVAAAARHHGAEVTILEMSDRPMARAVPREIGAFYRALHERNAVRLQFGDNVVAIEGSGAGPVAVATESGARYPADIVVVGIGSIPNDELAVAAGLATDRGVVVDAYGRTSDPHIFAAGDVARHFNPLLGRHILLESWQNAQNQAIAVAHNIVGPPLPYAEIPWFWTSQYEYNLQMSGLPADDARIVMRGGFDARSWLVMQVAGDRLIYAAGVNCPRDLRACKDIMTSGVAVDAAMLADEATKLASLIPPVPASA